MPEELKLGYEIVNEITKLISNLNKNNSTDNNNKIQEPILEERIPRNNFELKNNMFRRRNRNRYRQEILVEKNKQIEKKNNNTDYLKIITENAHIIVLIIGFILKYISEKQARLSRNGNYNKNKNRINNLLKIKDPLESLYILFKSPLAILKLSKTKDSITNILKNF